MTLSTRIRRLLTVGAVLAASVAWAAPAHAGPDRTVEQRQVVGRVLTAADRTAAYNALSPAQQALFRDSLDHLVPVTTVDRGGPVAATAAVPAAARCWYRYWYTTWSDLGYTEGATWMQLNWCGSGGRITSHSLGAHAGKSLSPGFSYAGVASTGGFNAGWEYRQYVEFAFNVGIGPVHTTLNPCMQIRGGATGRYSEQKSCNLG